MNDLTAQPQSGGRNAVLTREQVVGNRELVRQIMGAVMIDGLHYGKIPGTGDRPTLLKPGAEVLLSTFRISTEVDVEDLGGDDLVHYRVTVKGTHGPTGIPLGVGVGECSSDEKKYKWRKPVVPQEFDATPRDRRQVVWMKGYDGGQPFEAQQVRVNPADVANTILKMAKKRALVDFTLTALAVSDLFSQDAEDLAEELREAALDPKDRKGAGGNTGGGTGGDSKTSGKAGTKAPTATSDKGGSKGGAAAMTQVPISDIKRRIDQIGVPEKDFLARFSITRIEDLPLKEAANALAWLDEMQRRVQPK